MVKTILILMILSGRQWEPVHAVEYPTQAACEAAAAVNTEPGWTGRKKAVCVPKFVAH